MKTQTLPPRASSLSESMRDIGYSLQTAIADIIDNSITAAASLVEICFDFTDTEPVLGIIDNGNGMDETQLIEAMRHGSLSPRAHRRKDDLGRFGLGLKTASFSQCRELTVISRKNGKYCGAVWDLDVVLEQEDWMIGILNTTEIHALPYVDKLEKNGTLVLWRKLDRLFERKVTHANRNALYENMDAVKAHLALVFHNFLATDSKQKKFEIRINGDNVEPFDPFCLNNKATQILLKETIRIDNHPITIQPYILPHHSKLSPQKYDYYKERSEFVSNQGVYIYRNNRLMAWGDWFRLVPKSEATKLARVRIDFPNMLDEYWTIDIKKSRAGPPPQVRDKLRQIVKRIADKSIRVHTGKGQRLIENVSVPLWARYAEHGGIRYSLNPEHPILQAFQGSLDEAVQKQFIEVLKIIEGSIPVETIYSDYSTNPKSFDEAETTDKEAIMAGLRVVFDILFTANQPDEEKFRKTANDIRLFHVHPEEIEKIIKEKFYD